MSSFSDREKGRTLILFDVDETLSKARRPALPEMLLMLQELRKRYVIGYVGGSDLVKQQEQLGADVILNFDYCFPENGLTAFKQGRPLSSQSFIKFLGEERYKRLVNYLLIKIAQMDIPIKRGTFIEFRNGMINVSPIGRNATVRERNDFEAFDKISNVRRTLVEELKVEFKDFDLTYSIGGQISFDVFPRGWDKTFCLGLVQDEGFEEIHFFGDKTYLGGNDYEIFNDPRTKGHTVKDPEDTLRQCHELFLS